MSTIENKRCDNSFLYIFLLISFMFRIDYLAMSEMSDIVFLTCQFATMCQKLNIGKSVMLKVWYLTWLTRLKNPVYKFSG